MAHAVLAAALLIACLLAACPASSAKLRVRKEIRNLSVKEWSMYLQGMASMMTISTEVGIMLFGPKYKEYDYFIIQHAYGALTPTPANNPRDPDISHFGPWFMTVHKAYELQVENSLLAIVPGLKALPYWKMYEDMSSGRYYNTTQHIFTDAFAGNLDGDPELEYALMNGPFGGREIGHFNYKKYAYISDVYNGSSIGALLRAPENLNPNPIFTRYPVSNLADSGPAKAQRAGLLMTYNRSSFIRCADPALVRSAWDFVSCIDLPASVFSGVDQNSTWAKTWQGVPVGSQPSTKTHGMFHSICGGVGPDNGGLAPTSKPLNTTIPGAQIMGDSRDVVTSPNDIILFIPHHANLDRLWMIWQASITKIDPIQASHNVLWGYPKAVNCQVHYTGCTPNPPITIRDTSLFDVMMPRMPFTDVFPHSTPGGATHFDMLTWVPDYTYDDMIPF